MDSDQRFEFASILASGGAAETPRLAKLAVIAAVTSKSRSRPLRLDIGRCARQILRHFPPDASLRHVDPGAEELDAQRFGPSSPGSCFRKFALHPVCQQTGVTGFGPGAAATSPAARDAACSDPGTGRRILPVISTSNTSITCSGALFQLSEWTYLFFAGAVPTSVWRRPHSPCYQGETGRTRRSGSESPDSRIAGAPPQPRTRLSMNGSSPSPTRETLSRSAATIATTSA